MTKVKISPIEDTLEIEETSQDETEVPSIPSPIEIPEVKQKRSRKKQEPITPPPPPPTPEEPAKIKKGKMIACNVCGKELLEKTFKYYHQLKCKPKQEIQEPPTPQPKPEACVVNFDFPRRAQRSEKYVSLISKAF